jgi:hypothetical protein
MEQVVSTANLLKALQRVKQNRGAPGMDGVTVQQLDAVWREQGDTVRQQLLAGDYRPQPVRRVEIPKPAGVVRLLGIPTVIDRLVQQALLRVLTPVFDPGFSEHSYGFRPGRSAHQAVEAARQYIEAGYTWVVDLDVEQFFDRVNPLRPSPSGCSNPIWLSPWAASALPWMALSTFTRTPRWLKGFYSRMGWPRALGYSGPRRSSRRSRNRGGHNESRIHELLATVWSG